MNDETAKLAESVTAAAAEAARMMQARAEAEKILALPITQIALFVKIGNEFRWTTSGSQEFLSLVSVAAAQKVRL